MPSSTASFLEPLSSPSPSPPPPEEQSNHSGPAGLDSGSELSELTEDEQEENREDGTKGAPVRTSSRESKRKRSGIIPDPMWGWAYKDKDDKKGEWRRRPVREEEEEEQSGPARAMEEEEEEDEDHDRGDDGERSTKEHALSDNEGEDEREDDDEDPAAPYSDDDTSTIHKSSRVVDDRESEDEDDDEDEGEPEVAISTPPSPAPSQKGDTRSRMSPELTDDENGEDEEADEEAVEDDPAAAESDVDDDSGAPVAIGVPTPVASVLPVLEDTTTLMDIDGTAPPSSLVAPIAAAAAGSSIMAGSSVVDPPSPSPSSSASSSGSPSSSRSASPEREADAPSDHEPEPEPERKTSKARSSARNKKKSRTRSSRKSKADAGPDQDAEVDVDADRGAGADADEADIADPEDVEADTPELELELESDLQPAHRAEALDVLATIELKFALLRERLYVEKMENLAWEEALVADDTHPELLHLHSELLKRRDKRVELASRRRDYEMTNVMKRRRLDEEGVWSWWKHERDDLQTEMVSDTNRKRRKLERERRALERPLPEYPIPNIPPVVEAPPTLRDMVKSYPFGVTSHAHVRHKGRVSPSTLVYPQLSTLSPTDIAHDLEFLYQHRRAAAGFDPHRSGMVNGALGAPGPPHGYEYPMNPLDGPGAGNRFGPPPPAFNHQHPLPYPQMQGPPPMMPGFPGQGPRLSHHHPAQGGSLPNMHHSQIPMEQDTAPVHRPDSRLAQPAPLMPQYANMGPIPGSGNLMRRSISPVQVQIVNNGAGPGVPIGMGAPPMPPGFAGSKTNGWVGVGQQGPSSFPGGVKEPRRPNSAADRRERDSTRERYPDGVKTRERDRDMERDRESDRRYEMQNPQMMQPRPPAHQHPHPHVHTVQGPVPHHHLGPHHHHHHHHHVHHHHHGQNGQGQGPAMSAAPPGAGVASGSNLNPRPSRDIEPRRSHSGAPIESIEPSSGPSRQPAASPHLWKGNDEQAPPLPDMARDRSRPSIGPPPVGPHERLMTPFAMTPSQSVQAGFPGSPRNGPGVTSSAPTSGVQSRRGSWSAPDSSLPRPGSSASQGHSVSGHSQASSHRLAVPRRPRTPNAQPGSSAWGSPPHPTSAEHGVPPSSPRSNGVPSHIKSPPNHSSAFAMRSPTRTGQQSLTVPQLPPPPPLTSVGHSSLARPTTPSQNGSPSLKAFGRVPASPGQPKAPAIRLSGLHPSEHPENSDMGGHVSVGQTANFVTMRTSPPLSLFSSSHPGQPHSSRLSNGGMSEAPMSSGPVAQKIVPVDGS